MKFDSIKQFEEYRLLLQEKKKKIKKHILVCAGTGCVAGGAIEVYKELLNITKELNLPLAISLETCQIHEEEKNYIAKSGCHGFCQIGPLIHILPQDILYTNVQIKDVKEIVEKTIFKEEIIEKLLYKDPSTKKRCKGRTDILFYAKQVRVALDLCGVINPESIDDYIAEGGFKALIKTLTEMAPDEVIKAVEESGLRGRGGGGFPTGRKWRSCARIKSDIRYVLCNGDEGDPGAFMDRSIMEGDPYKVIEGMCIGAYAVSSTQGYIYVRHEYPLAVERLKKALQGCYERGLLGNNILGTNFSFNIGINRGGGAFVCGESSALMRSIEGKVGEPRAKYIRSVEKGVYDKPTVLNNVETWACVPPIIEKGASWFASMGTKTSTGTKVFSLVGKVKNTGLIEIPMGTTLREIVFELGGGIIKDLKFKAVQTGGPSGGCIPEALLDLPVDFDELTKAGSMMGSGGIIVMDERTCMVDVAKYFTKFLVEESCGKCVPCREGLRQLLYILERICEGKGKIEDIDKILILSEAIQESSLCGLGTSAPNPVLSTIKYFKEEYLEHILNKKCRAGVCKELFKFEINENCTGCVLCYKKCPTNAIKGGVSKEKHEIIQDKCIKCGICFDVCKFKAISIK